jgi:hypothetical protein
MECGDVTPLLFLSLACQRAKETEKNKKNKETKAVLHHRTP